MQAVRTISALARSCHPAPCVAVTVFSTALAVLAGNTVGRCAVLAAAVLAGQLSIGWSNDRIDRARDQAAARKDKPVARGEIAAATIDRAIGVALLATVVLSFALGWRVGLLHCAAVGCGWLYNVGLKATVWSWLPYAVAFGSLPAIATLALPHPRAPGGWIVLVAAVLGVVANLTNTLPDLRADQRAGIRGLPHRLGARWSVLLGAGLLIAATVVLVFAPSASPGVGSWAALVVVAGLVAAGVPWAIRHPLSRAVFYGLIALVAVQLGLIFTTGNHLH